jgi:hypothetical protein
MDGDCTSDQRVLLTALIYNERIEARLPLAK